MKLDQNFIRILILISKSTAKETERERIKISDEASKQDECCSQDYLISEYLQAVNGVLV